MDADVTMDVIMDQVQDFLVAATAVTAFCGLSY